MARKRKSKETETKQQGVISGAGIIEEQNIEYTLTSNYMPYAMSVIMSRAIPEIDGFKPSHRKLLYTMYKMGLMGNQRTKSANIVGQTMKLNPHGDGAIYDTMVRLSRGYEALLHPFVDSKGNFGKFYSRDMACAASRYTEAKLDGICREIFRDIDSDTVDFVDNYDNTMKEPSLLPVAFPSILVNANTGIAVGMASSICPFNLSEICQTTIELISNPDHDILSTLQGPDFPGGGLMIFDPNTLSQVYKTGRGPIKIRSRYSYDKAENCIDVTEIPPTTSAEAIVEKVIDLVKTNKLKDISDIRDETGLSGLKITIDLKRGVDPHKLMQRLFKITPLEENFSCNFNVLIAGVPKVLGVKSILEEWIAFRSECVKRRTYYELAKKKEKLHLLKGLNAILLDIDKAIKIVRETSEDSEVVPNLMIGFGIDEIQAEYVAEIKLRQLNKEYILKRIDEIDSLEKDVENLQSVLNSKTKVKNIIIKELKAVIEKYGQTRKTMLIFADEIEDEEIIEEIPDYPVKLFFTKEGYFKKITPLSLRMSGEHKLKADDEIMLEFDSTNASDLLFISNKSKVYKAKANDFSDTKTSVMGDYIPAKVQMEQGELALSMVQTKDYKGYLLFFFENGKVAKVELSSYATKTNRKKLVNAYSDKSPLVKIIHIFEDVPVILTASNGRMLIFNSSLIAPKATKNTLGVQAMNFKKGHILIDAKVYETGLLTDESRYKKKIPATGALPKAEDDGMQVSFDL
ncbi:MAG: DNA topoisomerase (ATP-hydrolyzing) subunit A [Clostridia bacterium]